MTLTKDKKTGTYKARVKTATGTTKTFSTKATTKPEAKRVLKQSRLAEIEEAAKAGRLTSEAVTQIVAGKRVTIMEALAQYSEWQKIAGRSQSSIYNSHVVVAQFAAGLPEHYGDIFTKPIATATEKMIYDYINAGDDRGLNWRRTQLSILNSFWEFCQAKGWVLGNPAKLVRVRVETLSHAQKEKKQRRPFTEGEVKRLLKATELGSFWHSAVAIARYTGLRLGDICQLEWDVFSVPGKIIAWTDKRDRRIALDLHPALADAIAAIPPVNTTYVFPEERAIYQDIKRKANLSTYFRRICHSLDILGKTFHDLRSTYCSECEKNGISVEHIARNVGHVSSKTTLGYIKRNAD